VARRPGAPLDPRALDELSPAFGIDLSPVRVHEDAGAAVAADALGAEAFVAGSSIVFGPGRYAPHDRDGRRLLVHELAHVVQQSRAAPFRDAAVGSASGPDEREAARVADTVTAGRSAPPIRARPQAALQRSIGSAAGGCGVCYRTPGSAGTAAHTEIMRAFRAYYGPTVLTNVHLPATAPGDSSGFLDLAEHAIDGFRIGEIKPANVVGLLQGDVDLFWYEDQLRKLGTPSRRMRLPPPPVTLTMPEPRAPNCPSQRLIVMPPIRGIYLYYCEPDFAQLVRNPNCRCRADQEPAPQPVAVPRSARERVREFIERIRAGVADLDAEAARFIRDHPEVKALLVTAAIGLAVGTVVEDVLTLGAGTADDPASLAAVGALLRAAQVM
jgi:hypothetical protein